MFAADCSMVVIVGRGCSRMPLGLLLLQRIRIIRVLLLHATAAELLLNKSHTAAAGSTRIIERFRASWTFVAFCALTLTFALVAVSIGGVLLLPQTGRFWWQSLQVIGV